MVLSQGLHIMRVLRSPVEFFTSGWFKLGSCVRFKTLPFDLTLAPGQETGHNSVGGLHSRDVCRLYLEIFPILPPDLSAVPDVSIFQINSGFSFPGEWTDFHFTVLCFFWGANHFYL